MNALRLKSAVAKHGEIITMTEEAAKAILKADEKDYTDEEVDKIYSTLLNGGDVEPSKETEPPIIPEVQHSLESAPKTPAMPNDGLDLDQFNYKALTGDSFDKYNKLVNELPLYEDKDFTQYMASGVFEMKHDKNLEKIQALVGIKINNDNPVNHTRIPVHVALEMNRQIENRDNPASNSRYYLLKK